MKLADIARWLDGEVICGQEMMESEVAACFAADLMSDVLAFSPAGAVLVTGLASIQSVHTANVADLRAIVFVHDKRPPAPAVEAARQKKIPLLTTGKSMFEACSVLFSHGLEGAARGGEAR